VPKTVGIIGGPRRLALDARGRLRLGGLPLSPPPGRVRNLLGASRVLKKGGLDRFRRYG